MRESFDVNRHLGKLFESLLKPPQPKPGAPPPPPPVLAYTGVGIKASGIVLHGSLAVADWPPPHVEFQQIPVNSGGGPAVAATAGLGPPEYDYTGLRSWIPGGTIKRYEWSYQGQAQPFRTDENRFVFVHPPPLISARMASARAVPGFVPICLTLRGERLSASGPVLAHPVSATVCGYTSLSILEGLQAPLAGALPMVALTHPGPGGLVEVAGHASTHPDGAGGGVPNRIVHFADERSADHLEFLLQALRESRREDAPTAVVAVLTPERLARTRHTEGLIYAEDQDGAWERAFGVKITRRPLTLIVAPNGNVVWQQDGEVDSETLAAALRRNLTPSRHVHLRMAQSSLRIGRPAPNFLFEVAPGRGLTLRKLAARPTILVFWRSSSRPSIEAVRDVQRRTGKAGEPGPVVLAINDGEASELAKRAAAESSLSATLVTDPERKISLAYGVNLWPTIVFIDASGLIRSIRYGRLVGEHVEAPSQRPGGASS